MRNWSILRRAVRHLENYNELYCVQDAVNFAIICSSSANRLYKMYGSHNFKFTSMSSYSFSSIAKRKTIIQCTPNQELMQVIEQCISGGFSASITSIMVDTRYRKMLLYDGIRFMRLICGVEVFDENNEYGGAHDRPLPSHGCYFREDLTTYQQLWIVTMC